MKILFAISLLVITSSVKSQSNDDVKKFLEALEKALEAIASLVPIDPDTDLSIGDFLNKYNYPLESHTVTTKDGFHLTMHRIPYGRNQKPDGKTRPVVFLKHCFTCSSMDFIYTGPDHGLALILADLGYDVWLPNTRGNFYSMNHTNLDPKKDAAKFWDFSFHEKGTIDIPACFDYVLSHTTESKITYVGYSQGTTEGLIFASSKPEYQEKLNLIVLLSPVGLMGHMTSPLPRLLVKYMDLVQLIFNVLNIHGVSHSSLFSLIGKVFCNDVSSLQEVCTTILSSLVGFDEPQMNKTLLTVILSNTPSGFSIKELIHYGQEIKSGYFRQYDYGKILNFIRYGNTVPPSYNVKSIAVPVALYYGKNDFFAAISDVETLAKELPTIADQYLIDYELFNHFDFILAKDVKKLLYERVIKTIQQYNPINNDP